MNYKDIVPLTYASKSLTPSIVQGSGTGSGTIGLVYDVNTSTYYQYQIYHGGDGSAEGSLTFDATWVKPCTIYSVYTYSSQFASGGNYRNFNFTYTTYLKINGSWTQVDTHTNTNGADTQVYEKTTSTGWNIVTGIRHYLHGYSYSYEGDRQQYATLRIHEVRVYREKNEEILRIKKPSGIALIGSNVLTSAHKARGVNKSGTIVGIPLLSTDDPTASTIRIYDGSSVKSLPLAD